MLFGNKLKKVVALAAAAVLAVSVLAGCGGGGETADDGKITIRIGHWPNETNVKYEAREKERLEYMEKNPNIIVEPDTYSWDAKTFTMLASSGQLPNLLLLPFTEAKKSTSAGYAADISALLAERGFLNALNPSLLEILSDEEGRVYGIPEYAYAQGLYINKEIFKEAGLVNEDGSVMIPSTYDEVAEFGKIIREKTGKAGLVFPTTGNGGGWHFLNVAWAYGVEFLKQNADGSYTAAFDTPEFKAALQYLHDLKWKYNAVQDNAVVGVEDQLKLFGTQQGGMTFYNPPGDHLAIKYGMPKENIVSARIPAGPKGRFSQMGGNFWFISANSTPEQMEAVFDWMMYRGVTPEVTEASKKSWADEAKQNLDNGGIILDRAAFALWVNAERVKAEEEAKAPYVNIDPKDYDDYFSFTDVIIRPEPEVAAQELYSVLDKAVQEIFTNPNVDFDAITKDAVKDYQLNHLDKLD